MSTIPKPDQCLSGEVIECKIAIILWKIFSPIFLIVGISGNLLSIAVLSRQRMRFTTTSVYLRLLAVVDTFVLLVAVLRHVLYYYAGINIRAQTTVGCKLHSWISPSVSALSFWLLPVITVDRLLMVKYPIWAKAHCTRRSSFIIFLVMFITLLLINLHFLLFQERMEMLHGNSSNITSDQVIDDLQSVKCAPGTAESQNFYNKIWPIAVFLLYSIMPIGFLITCNVVLVKEVTKRTAKNRARRSFDPRKVREQKDLRSLTIMLVSVCVFFVIISVPACVHLILESYVYSEFDAAKRLLSWTVVTLLLFSNNTVNFILYCFTGKVFRKELVSMLKDVKSLIQKRVNKLLNKRVHPTERKEQQIPREVKGFAGPSSLDPKTANTNVCGSELVKAAVITDSLFF